jgi:RimJ/RimL family protein N-acetyltransferase
MAMYETDRILLRPFSKEDVTDAYKSWFHDQEVCKYNSHGLFPYTDAQMQSFLARLDSPDNLVLAIVAKNDAYAFPLIMPLHIGNIALQNINWINRSAELAVVIGDKDYWKKGYCTEAASILFDHGFNKLNLHRIWTGTAKTNGGMIKVAMKLGMKVEGIFRDAMYLEGEYVDVISIGILKDKWNNPTSETGD